MSSCGVPTITCVLLLLFLGAIYATASPTQSGRHNQLAQVSPLKEEQRRSHRIYEFKESNKRRIPGRIVYSGRNSRTRRPHDDDGRRGGRGCRRRGCQMGRLRPRQSRKQMRLATKLAKAVDMFARKLLKLAIVGSSSREVVVSPFSIHAALSMTSKGAKGFTRRQIEKALGIKSVSMRRKQMHRAYNTLLGLLPAKHPKAGIMTASGVFVRVGIPLEYAFKLNIQQFYKAKFDTFIPGHEPEKVINSWIANSTHGRMNQMVAPGFLNNQSSLVLVNTLSLNASWQRPFRSLTPKEKFHTLKHGPRDISMMEQDGLYRISNVQGSTLVQIPYKSNDTGSSLAMFILLPNKGRSIFQALKVMKIPSRRTHPAATLDDVFNSVTSHHIRLVVPKFQVSSGVVDLGPSLMRMGIRKAFNSKKANFAGISSLPGLYIDKVFHNAFLRVDETGTETGPATGVHLSPPIPRASRVIKVNRPFLFFVRDTQLQLTLLSGCYTGDTLNTAQDN